MRIRLFLSLLLTLLPPLPNAQIHWKPEGSTVKVIVQRVVFSKPTLLSQEDLARVTGELRGSDLQFSTFTWRQDFNDYAEALIERVYQDRGYFLAKAFCETVTAENNFRASRVNLFVAVREGAQYRLSEIRWKNLTAFAESRLMALMPIHPGEIFSRAKVAAGLDAVGWLYRSLGFINCTYVPNTEFNETEHSISLEIDVDEGGIFHWGDLHLEGMSEPDRQVLLQEWEGLRGQVYTSNSQ